MTFTRRFPVRHCVFFAFLFVILAVGQAQAQTLRFDPDIYIPSEPSFAVPMLLESGGLDIKGVETTVTFNPALVTLDSITPGPWYTASGQDFFFWDYTVPYTYAIHFASAMLDGSGTGDGIIAYCHFTILDFGSCDLIFTDWDVRDPENAELVFTEDHGLILLDPAVTTRPVSFSALKAIYR